jgi:hypothetical protein
MCAARQFFDAYRWEIFIVEHLPQLFTLNFKFFSWNIDQNIIDQYRCPPFWLDKHWYVTCDSSQSFLFTVPYFAPYRRLIIHLIQYHQIVQHDLSNNISSFMIVLLS